MRAAPQSLLDYVLSTLILIIAPHCMSADMPSELEKRLNYNNTGYEAHLRADYQIVCMGGVSIDSIESVTLPLLRTVFPDSAIVFAYGGNANARDYQLYISAKYGPQFYKMVNGNADVELGYALAPLSDHAAIQHERAHLELCAAHSGDDSNPNDASTWTRAVKHEKPWCPPLVPSAA